MKIKGATEKWVSGVLGVVCLLIVMHLVRGGTPSAQEKGGAPLGQTPETRRIPVVSLDEKNDLSRYNPEVKLDLLNDLQQRDLPTFERNPFEFPKPKEPPKPPGPPVPPDLNKTAPPPPPPPPIKMIGYSEKAGGTKEAIVSEEPDGPIYVVHEGETFNKRYKVNKLTSTSASIYDEETHQTVELPIPPT